MKGVWNSVILTSLRDALRLRLSRDRFILIGVCVTGFINFELDHWGTGKEERVSDSFTFSVPSMFVFFRCKVVNPHWYPSSAFGLLFCRCLFLELARYLLTCLHSQTLYFNFFPVALQGSSDHRKAEFSVWESTSGCCIVNATAVLLIIPSTQKYLQRSRNSFAILAYSQREMFVQTSYKSVIFQIEFTLLLLLEEI